MPSLDVFKADGFSVASLTTLVNNIETKQMRIDELKLFDGTPVRTTAVQVEERDRSINLIPNRSRREPGRVAPRDKGRVRGFETLHLTDTDTILADDVQNLRGFGSETELRAVGNVVRERVKDLKANHEVTLEHLRLGALSGRILDADGATVIYNLYDEFGLTETSIDFALGTGTTDVRGKCVAVCRAVEAALGGVPMDHVHAFCSDGFFDALVSHAKVEAAYERYQAGAALREDVRRRFVLGGIVFENYGGVSVGGKFGVAADTARFFPVGTPNMFKNYWAPANYNETANTLGKPFYSKQERLPFDKGVEIETQSNPLPMATRPEALVKGAA